MRHVVTNNYHSRFHSVFNFVECQMILVVSNYNITHANAVNTAIDRHQAQSKYSTNNLNIIQSYIFITSKLQRTHKKTSP